PSTNMRAAGSPKPGIGRPQYVSSRKAARFSRATCSRHATRRGQRRHAVTDSLSAGNAAMAGGGIHRGAPPRVGRLALAVLALLAFPAVAHATELKPSWGYANINDQAFYDNSGALLPVGQAFPRGQIKDAGVSDGWAVKLTVSALSITGATLASYT